MDNRFSFASSIVSGTLAGINNVHLDKRWNAHDESLESLIGISHL